MKISNRMKFIVLGIAAVFFIGMMFLLTKTQPNISTTTPGQPKITSYVKQQFPIESKFSENDYKFPTSLPIINIIPSTISIDTSKEVARKLNFSDEPEIFSDVFDGDIYFWKNDESSLTIRPKLKQIEYKLSETVSSTRSKLSEDELINKTKQFVNKITNTNSFSSNVIFYKEEINDSHGAQITTYQNANFAIVNLYPNITEYKIVREDFSSSTISVRILIDGTIEKLELIQLGELRKSESNFKIKDYKQFANSLNQAKVVSFEDGEIISPNTTTFPIKSVEVNTVELAYYLESPSSSFMQPIFLIKGTADFESLGRLNTTLSLPAITN